MQVHYHNKQQTVDFSMEPVNGYMTMSVMNKDGISVHTTDNTQVFLDWIMTGEAVRVKSQPSIVECVNWWRSDDGFFEGRFNTGHYQKVIEAKSNQLKVWK